MLQLKKSISSHYWQKFCAQASWQKDICSCVTGIKGSAEPQGSLQHGKKPCMLYVYGTHLRTLFYLP